MVEVTERETLDWCNFAFRNTGVDGVFDHNDVLDIRAALCKFAKDKIAEYATDRREAATAAKDAEIEALRKLLARLVEQIGEEIDEGYCGTPFVEALNDSRAVLKDSQP